MTVVNIKNRLLRLEHANDGYQKVVAIFSNQTDEEAFALAGVEVGGDVHIVRVQLMAMISA